MLEAGIPPVGLDHPGHLGGSDLAVSRGNGKHLVPGGFHSAGFMDVDVAADRAQRPLVGPQGGVNDRQVGLGAAHQEVNRQVLPAAEGADLISGAGAVGILTIARGLLQIGTDQGFQHLRVAAFGIVIVKIDHGLFS